MVKNVILLLSLCILQPFTCLAKPNKNRGSSFPFVSGDSFRSIADHIFDETSNTLSPQSVKEGDIIFLKTDYLEQFFTTIHPQIQHKYILITHNSDYGAPGIFERFLDDDKLHAWFGMSPTVKNHPKFIPIPIGIANECWKHGDTETFMHLIKSKKIRQPKKFLLGINFPNINTNLAERSRAFNYFSKLSCCTDISSPKHVDYLINMAYTKFVVSPAGNSLDCHRTWEALLAGSYPIVLSSNLDPLFDGLPVFIVQRWEDITDELLTRKYAEFQCAPFTNERLLFLYWFKKIGFYKNQLDPS